MPDYSKDDLEILIATMNRDDFSFLEKVFQKSIHDIDVAVLIINQSKAFQLESDFENIKVINDRNFGLSRSRNLAIKNSTKKLLWLLDDDCEILPESINRIVAAHNHYDDVLLTFKTLRREDGKPFRNYPSESEILTVKQIKKILSPEITFKKPLFDLMQVDFDERFGLGAQFQDSENFIFLEEMRTSGGDIHFIPEYIVIHDAVTSSDEADSDRLIYARGALAGRKSTIKAIYLNYKYTFFLWRRGFVRTFHELINKHRTFRRGIEDYRYGFEKVHSQKP